MTKKTAVVCIRRQQMPAHQAVHEGLRALGYETKDWSGGSVCAEPADLLVTWNLHGWRNDLADIYKAAGRPVIVAENGYLGEDRTALALDGHNGSGRWPYRSDPFSAPGDRWRRLGLGLRPWRRAGTHILVCGQRGIGSPSMASPRRWMEETAAVIGLRTDRPIVQRPHPGREKKGPPLAEDLDDCWAVVVWSSGAAAYALLAGVPVFYAAPTCIVAPAALTLDGRDLERPWTGDRLPMFNRLAWAQWSAAEIASGAALSRLIAMHEPAMRGTGGSAKASKTPEGDSAPPPRLLEDARQAPGA